MNAETETKIKARIDRIIETQFKYLDRNNKQTTEQYIKDFFKMCIFESYKNQIEKPKKYRNTLKEIINYYLEYEYITTLTDAKAYHTEQSAILENRATD